MFWIINLVITDKYVQLMVQMFSLNSAIWVLNWMGMEQNFDDDLRGKVLDFV